MIDTDNDDKITAQEYLDFGKSMGQDGTLEDAKNMIYRFDYDGDGTLSRY